MHPSDSPRHYSEARKDRATEEVVARGIAMADRSGRKEAAAFLSAMGVAFPVIVRVLDTHAVKRANQSH
jgi:hypothetical protein